MSMFNKKGKLKENQNLPPQGEQKKEEPKAPQVKMRQILILTDGNVAKIEKAEVAGSLELKAILQGLADGLK